MSAELALSTKWLQVRMPSGAIWHIPCDAIARIAASLEGRRCLREGGNAEAACQEYYAALMGDEQQLLAAAAQLHWEDVEAEAIQVQRPPEPDYGVAWLAGEKRVVEQTRKGGDED